MKRRADCPVGGCPWSAVRSLLSVPIHVSVVELSQNTRHRNHAPSRGCNGHYDYSSVTR